MKWKTKQKVNASKRRIKTLRFEILDYFLNIIVDGIEVGNKTYYNMFWSMHDLLNAINVNPRNNEFNSNTYNKLKTEFKNKRKLANNDVETLQQIKKVKVRVNSQLFSKTITQSSPKTYCVLQITITGKRHKTQYVCNSLVGARKECKTMLNTYSTCWQISPYAFFANNDVSQAIIIISPISKINK